MHRYHSATANYIQLHLSKKTQHYFLISGQSKYTNADIFFKEGITRGEAKRYAPRQWQFDGLPCVTHR